MALTTVQYSSVSNYYTNKAPQFSNGSDVLSASILNARVAPNQPDAQGIATVARALIDDAGNNIFDSTNGSPKTRGTVALANGVTDLQITGMGLQFVPQGVLLSVIHASNAKTEVRVFLVGTPTNDGFTVHFPTAPADGTYILAFQIF